MIKTNLIQYLNEPQCKAVTAPWCNALILAGAGSGKTRVLVNRMAWLIEEHHLSAQSILAVTFTNKAASEMRSRLGKILSIPIDYLWVGTFHGLCHRLLRRHYKEANLSPDFYIIDNDDQMRIIKRAIASLNLDIERWPIKQAQSFINNNKNEGLMPDDVFISKTESQIWLNVYRLYEQICHNSGVIDFAGLILHTLNMLANNPEILAQYHEQFQAILVDEFQDTNTIQYAWIRLLADKNTAVMVVGDDDQSIYSWRGAKIDNINRFSKDFYNPLIIKLEQNYRSTATILEAANSLITNNNFRVDKKLWTADSAGEKIITYSAINELDEARFVSERINFEMKEGLRADDIAILYRSNAQSRVIEESLLHAGITYRIYGGVRFFDRAEVKDAIAYLRLLINPNDDAAFERVVNFPARGIGEKTLDDIRYFAKSEMVSLWDASKLFIQTSKSQRPTNALLKFLDLIKELQTKTLSLDLDKQLNRIIQDSGLYAHFSGIKGEKSVSCIDNLHELITAAKQFCTEYSDKELPLVNAFLAYASLESLEMQTEDFGSVHLMTLHAAKGLEFPLIFIVGLEEGLFPSRQALEESARLEEERRLCYVGMTRAMKKLVLTHSKTRCLYGHKEYHRPSRFLQELPSHLIHEVHIKAKFQTSNISVKNQPIAQEHKLLGKTVTHSKFGEGVVLAVEGQGAHTRVQVKFASEGVKWLVLRYANLSDSLEVLHS